MGRKIHTELIISSIFYFVRDVKSLSTPTKLTSKDHSSSSKDHSSKENIFNFVLEKNKAINNLNYILSWGMYFKNVNGNKEKINLEINDFIHYIYIDVLNAIQREKNKQKYIKNISPQFYENFNILAVTAYEFMTLYNLKDQISGLKELKFEDLIVPRAIFSGLNLEHAGNYDAMLTSDIPKQSSRDPRSNSFTIKSPTHPQLDKNVKKKDFASDLWSDYKLFEMIYQNYSSIFNISVFDVSGEKNKITKLQKICEECFENKKKRDCFAEEIKILYFIYKPDSINGEKLGKGFSNLPILKILSNMFMITLSLLQDESEIRYWLDEYERFLSFVILSACNITMKDSKDEVYLTVQDLTIDVVTFGLAFLLDEYYNTKKDSLFKSKNYKIINFILILYFFIF